VAEPFPPRRIFLVGLSGSGKSTAGPLAAERLGWTFVDADREVEEREGRPIGDIFAADGEARFRELEAAALAALAGREAIVVATGGGALTTAAGRAAVAGGVVIFLDVSPGRAAERLEADPASDERPLLAGDPAARLQKLFWEREALYRRADFSVDVDDRTPEQAAVAITACWERARAGFAPDPTFRPGRLEEP
jgi:shikimate kinase